MGKRKSCNCAGTKTGGGGEQREDDWQAQNCRNAGVVPGADEVRRRPGKRRIAAAKGNMQIPAPNAKEKELR